MKPQLPVVLMLVSVSSFAGTEYPFADLPDSFTATLHVTPGRTEPANNRLLGYNIFGFSTEKEKDFIRTFDPVTIRFPHGVWANFYDWETDGYTRHGDTYNNKPHDAVLGVYAERNIRCGLPGLNRLNDERRERVGQGFDMIWTYNLNYDDNAKSVARLRDSEARGLEVRDIEMGNEHFWKNQRSTRTSTPEQYLEIARSLSAALKREKPEVRVSIPLSWRRSHGGYNKTIAGDGTHFDAISVHKYVGADPDKPGESDKAYGSVLTARLTMEQDVNFAQTFAPGKPVWLTEWGVSCGRESRAAAALGMVDCYLFLFENRDVYERANWFCVNGVLNSFITISDKRVIKYPLEKTYYGAAYEIVREVFEDARLLHGTMETETLKTEAGTTNAVNARAVSKGGKTTVLAVNLTDRAVPFALTFDGVPYAGGYTHGALVFGDLAEVGVLDIDIDPLKPVGQGQDTITLPPLSINRISDIDSPHPR